jgi:hypothetical protein
MGLSTGFLQLSTELDRAGLIWHPEIGDEVAYRQKLEEVSIFVDPQGLTPKELREHFLWLPTVEQLVHQFEARQAVIYHAGLNDSFAYETVIKTADRVIEAAGNSLRLAFGNALYDLLAKQQKDFVH